MPKKPTRVPERYCPVCGDYVGREPSKWDAHRCRPRTLSAIDAAHRRDEEAMLPRTPSDAQRLNAGLEAWEKDLAGGWDDLR